MASQSDKPSGKPRSSSTRLHYIDWLRGLAALIMLQGHTFHSFTRSDLRGDPVYLFTQFLGGMPPAIFLFLLGITLAFRMDGGEKRGLAPTARVTESLKRAGYLAALAFAFRFQMWLFGYPHSRVSDLLIVDILNCMALSVALLAPLALFGTAERIRLAAGAGLTIAALAPLVSMISFNGAPMLVEHYLKPDLARFAFFPWAAFTAFGVSVGSILRSTPEEGMDRAMQWSALFGGGLIFGSQYFANLDLTIYPAADFWVDSPALILIKLGVMLWMMTFAFVWTRYAAPEGWSWIRQFGITSLLVYWVHVELVYGSWLWKWKESLSILQTMAATVGVVVLMLALSLLRTSHRLWWPTVRAWNPLRWLSRPSEA
jgi:uncharacterized membrane protein